MARAVFASERAQNRAQNELGTLPLGTDVAGRTLWLAGPFGARGLLELVVAADVGVPECVPPL